MNTDMNDALSALGGEAQKLDQVQTAPSKIATDKIVVAVKLARNPNTKAVYMEAADQNWLAPGVALAIKAGHVIARNPVLGHWSKWPRVLAAHLAMCPKCGRTAYVKVLSWEGKDFARRRGVKEEALENRNAWPLIREYNPTCPCGGTWTYGDAEEDALCSAFKDEVLKTIEKMSSIPEFVKPEAFTVHPVEEAVPLPPEFQWLSDKMGVAGKSAIPFEQNKTGDCIVYNPGFWLGTVDDLRDPRLKDLFFPDDGKARRGHSGQRFDPGSVDGL